MPLKYNLTLGVFAFEATVIPFVKGPSLAALNSALTVPFAPGCIGYFVQSVTVQPQVFCTLDMISGSFPTFVNSNL